MKQGGFTLIELLVVAVIVAILGAVVVGAIGGGGGFHAETYSGRIDENAQIGRGNTGWFASQDAKEIAFSRAVSIELANGEFLTFSTVDRQFATVKKGDCVEVRVQKYGSLNFAKAGTYHNGRLKRKFRCPGE
jgi:prepilin-type N-terminal cleavage/methylation domain-containing protein